MSIKQDWLGRAAALTIALALASAASAETLQDALVAAYENNPELMAQRAALRSADEQVSLAVSQSRPSIGATVGLTQDFEGVNLKGDGRALTARADLELPIFQGGRVRNAVKAAEERVGVGRQDLRAVENQVILDTVAAYMDVLRDQSVVELNRNQVTVLTRQLQASRDRFEVGDVTRTDVAQSEARLSLARSQLIAAEAQLIASRQSYYRQVGREPGELAPPPPLPATLPGTAEQAVDLALAYNPNMIAARAAEKAAAYDVRAARGAGLPTVSATSGIRHQDFLGDLDSQLGVPPGTVDDSDTASSVGLSVTVPLYQSGATSARIRDALARRSLAMEQIIANERFVTQTARNAWASLEASRATIVAAKVAVDANELAAEGTRQENQVGTRNILDVLNAEQELLNSRVDLVRAERNEYVAGFAVLSAIGRAEARDLALPVNLYDPDAYYKRVRNRWIGTGVDVPLRTKPASAATSTQDVTTPQN